MSQLLNVPIPSINEATQNAARLLQQSLAEGSQAGNGATVSATDLELARSNVKALAFVQGVGLHGAYRYLRDFIARQAIPIYSADEFLDGWLATYSLARKEASAAFGTCTGTGVAASTLEAGALLVDDQGRQYHVTADAVVAGDGTVVASVIALVPGIAGNAVAGLALSLLSPVTGVDSAFVVSTGALGGGADLEADAQAIYRLQQRLANEPRGGSPADYARWALSLPGITRAWGVRNPAGPTSAGVIIMADANVAPGLPTPGQQRSVLDYIRDPRRGPPDELFVIIPNAELVTIVLSLSPDTPEIRANVTAEVQDLFFRESVPGGSLPHSHITEVISAVAGENNHTIYSPVITTGGVITTSGFDSLLVLASVEFV